jgi:hypothetical protein
VLHCAHLRTEAVDTTHGVYRMLQLCAADAYLTREERRVISGQEIQGIL